MKGRDFTTAVAFLGMVAWAIRPRSGAAELVGTLGAAHKSMIRAAMAPAGPLGDVQRSEADRYAAAAADAVADFWRGFAE